MKSKSGANGLNKRRKKVLLEQLEHDALVIMQERLRELEVLNKELKVGGVNNRLDKRTPKVYNGYTTVN